MTTSSYLTNLTLKISDGLGRLPEEERARHIDYLLKKTNADGGYSGREGKSDLYYTGFALRSLAVLGELHGERAAQAAKFLRGRLHTQVSPVDFFSLIYSVMLLENAAGETVFRPEAGDWKSAVANALEGFRRADGGYAKGPEGESSSTYYSFLAILCLQLLERPLVQPERLVPFFLARRREDGGFVEIGPAKRSGTNPTAAAVTSLNILNALNDDIRAGAIDFFASMQTDEGGLRANTRIPIADLLSTFTGLATLSELGSIDELDCEAARNFARQVELPRGGFRAALWDEGNDVEYTFYGLGTLALTSRRLSEPAA